MRSDLASTARPNVADQQRFLAEQEALDLGKGGVWPWLLQRVTAVILLVTLTIHLVVLHLLGIGDLTFETIGERLAGALFIVVDLTLLAAVLFHALNGLRMVLLDYWFGGTGRRVLDVVLWVVGLGTLVYGIWGLWPWIAP